jgi:hypothetical protein
MSDASLKLPVPLRILGDEIRALKDYCARGLITPEEASERIEDWELFYPSGWHDIETLVDARRHQGASIELASEFAEAAE